MSQFHTLIVSEVKRETAKAVSILFDIPENLRQEYNFKAGQYITLKAKLDNKEVRRDYSICSSPQSGELRVAVKEVEDGLFSRYANKNLKVGDSLDVSAPNGRFIFAPQPGETRNFAAFVAGSGITPVLSIIKSVLSEEPNSSISIIYGNKSLEDCMFYSELLNLEKEYSGRFKVKFIFSRTQESDALFGRIDNSTSNFFINNVIGDTSIDTYFLCGPEEMIYQVSDLLKGKGVDSEKIKFELFAVKLESKSENPIVTEGSAHITIMLDDEESSFTMESKNTILEAALAENIDAPYSCQGGICSSCLARITKGEVKMRQNNILTDDEVAEGLVLTCQSQPITENVYVDYDDV